MVTGSMATRTGPAVVPGAVSRCASTKIPSTSWSTSRHGSSMSTIQYHGKPPAA